MTALIVSFWREVLIIFLLLISYLLYNALTISKLETVQYRDGLEYQNASLLSQKESYDKKLAELPKEIEIIKTRYKVIYEHTENFKKDENETDCNASYRYLSTFPY